jgi:hypothetical protein
LFEALHPEPAAPSMLPIEKITAIEDEYHFSHTPSLGRAYDALVARWKEGARDRETALRLLFFIWYGLAEPPYFTGLKDVNRTRVTELFQRLGGEFTTDPEVLFVVTVMCENAPWALGEESYWRSVGERFRRRLQQQPEPGLSKLTFARRGAYGYYFANRWETFFPHP